MVQFKPSRYLLATLSLIIFVACNCETFGDGIVLDANTNKPVSGVIVKSYIEKSVPSFVSEMITDSTGIYTGTTGKTKGGFAGCKDLLLEFHKEGYSMSKAYNPQSETVYLRQTE